VVLSGPGIISRDEEIEWAQEQYDAFQERRRLEAEAVADARYVEDLRTSAKILEANRNKSGKSKKIIKPRKT
jgi:hypothetical protein